RNLCAGARGSGLRRVDEPEGIGAVSKWGSVCRSRSDISKPEDRAACRPGGARASACATAPEWLTVGWRRGGPSPAVRGGAERGSRGCLGKTRKALCTASKLLREGRD